MAFIRPSLVLQAMLTPADYTPETEREIKRSYNFIASAIVKQLEGDAAADGNVMQFRIRLMKPYWDTSDAAARELWDAVMPRWLHNQTLNVTTAMHNYNTVTHNPGATNVTYAWADFEFNNHATIRVKLNDDNTMAADVVALAEAVRKLANEGAFGEEMPALIRIPSKANLEAQHVAYEALEAEVREARARAEAEAAQAAAAEAEEVVAEDVREEVVEAAQAETAETAEAAETAQHAAFDWTAEARAHIGGEVVIDAEAVAQADTMRLPGDEVEAKAADPLPTLPPFTLDFSVWGLEYADGRVVEFDSAAC